MNGHIFLMRILSCRRPTRQSSGPPSAAAYFHVGRLNAKFNMPIILRMFVRVNCVALLIGAASVSAQTNTGEAGVGESSEAAINTARPKVAVACPGYQQQLKRILETENRRVGISGLVRARLIVDPIGVQKVEIISGPVEYHESVKHALESISCRAFGADRLVVPLDLIFQGR